MRTSLKFAVPVLSLAIVLLFTGAASAQTVGIHGSAGIAPRGVPASVTSFGFGGHPGFHGVPASVTSQGFGANFGVRGVPGKVNSFGFGRGFRVHDRPFGFNHRRRVVFAPFYGGFYPAYSYPYYSSDYDWSDYDQYQPNDPSAHQAEDMRGDDARQQLNDDYRAELNSAREERPEEKPAPEPVVSQPNTVLIFKDGHQVEI